MIPLIRRRTPCPIHAARVAYTDAAARCAGDPAIENSIAVRVLAARLRELREVSRG